MSAADNRQVVVELEGNVASEVAASQFRGRLQNALNQGYETVLVSVGQVAYIDSVLLGAVIQAHLSAIRVGAHIKVMNATKRFRELLVITKLDRVLDLTDDQHS